MASVGSIENVAAVHETLHRLSADVKLWMINLSRGTYQLERVRLEAIASGKGVEAHTNDFVASEWYGYAGDTGHALASIRAAIAKHDSSVLGLAVLPAYDSLQKNAEYEGIVRGLGLEVRR